MADSHVQIEFRCACSAMLVIEIPQSSGYLTEFLRLARAFVDAHASHHIEPAAKEQSHA